MTPHLQNRHFRPRLRRFLTSSHAPWITHLGLLVLTALFYSMLLLLPIWIAFAPSVMIGHRIGVLLHDYFHGIPFRRYRDNLAVITCFDGIMLMFGSLELFRATHLAHHRWLNTDLDPAKEATSGVAAHGLWNRTINHPISQNLIYLASQIKGDKPYVRVGRIGLGAILSLLTVCFWWYLGCPEMILKIFSVVMFTTLVPVSLRGAIEHYSFKGDSGFANEYRVLIPLFNINRHIHHHEQPTVPWYLLEFRTASPLSIWSYFTYWFRVNVRRDLVLMRPMRRFGTERRMRH